MRLLDISGVEIAAGDHGIYAPGFCRRSSKFSFYGPHSVPAKLKSLAAIQARAQQISTFD
jgi:hypothetical protein